MSTDIENVAEYLPDVVHEMVNIAGFSDVEKIIKRFGGSRFRFSDGIHYFPKLKELIGKESAIKLRTHFQSEEIYIPRCDVALRVLRNQRLKADFDYLTQREGKSGRMSMLEICYKYKISDRQAWDIVYSLQREPKAQQTTLF
uniref:Mor transcription activator family protein n=1 Tax=Pasteurella multocida TaxID=747 RepID=UPI00403D75DB